MPGAAYAKGPVNSRIFEFFLCFLTRRLMFLSAGLLDLFEKQCRIDYFQNSPLKIRFNAVGMYSGNR